MVFEYGLHIDGEELNATTGESLEIINPATLDVIGSAPSGTTEDVESAISAARDAYENEWRHWSGADRADALRELADAVKDEHDNLVELETLENGKPLHESDRDVRAAANKLEFYAGAADKHHGETLPSRSGAFDVTVKEPYGVAGIIIPWNWPPMHVVDFLAPVLAGGNTAVLKPAPETPLTALKMAKMFAAVLPDGVFNVVSGDIEPGVALTTSSEVDVLTFTGNSQTGSKVLEAASQHITPVMLELGGKNAAIVFDDADLDTVVPGLIDGSFFNSGEACSSSERILLQEGIHDEFLERFVEETRALTVGDGMDSETDVGPLISRQEYDKVREYIEVAQEEGAELVYEGNLPERPDLQDGFFVPPHIFDEVDPEMRLFSEEVFGPVVAVTSFETEQEAIDLANATEYGLTGGVFTEDARRSIRVSKELRTGTDYVNNFARGGLAPFGGYKRSGIGRKNAFRETMDEFTQTKTIKFNTGSSVRTTD
jgi:aldehyde dehydrogenase (NAD+)